MSTRRECQKGEQKLSHSCRNLQSTSQLTNVNACVLHKNWRHLSNQDFLYGEILRLCKRWFRPALLLIIFSLRIFQSTRKTKTRRHFLFASVVLFGPTSFRPANSRDLNLGVLSHLSTRPKGLSFPMNRGLRDLGRPKAFRPGLKP